MDDNKIELTTEEMLMHLYGENGAKMTNAEILKLFCHNVKVVDNLDDHLIDYTGPESLPIHLRAPVRAGVSVA